MEATAKPFSQQIRSLVPYSIVAVSFVATLLIRFTNSTWISEVTGSYLSVHIVLEFVGILVSFAVFTVGWATYRNVRDLNILVLSMASLAVGFLDLGHTLSFTGMPDFFGPSGPNKAIDFWFASRTVGALAFMYVAVARPLFSPTKYFQWFLFTASLAWIGLCGGVILRNPNIIPNFFIPGVGLTPFKVIYEWVLVAISCVAGIILFVDAEKKQNMSVRWMACASLLYGMCGYFFTIYKDFDDVYNFCGHVFKAISYILLYRAVFVECITKPYERVKQLAAEAEASNLSKSRFLANVSHEFRTPLGVISGFSELLLNSKKLEQPLEMWAQTIMRNSRQLSLLIDDLLDLAKAETSKIDIRITRFDVEVLVNQVKQALGVHLKSGVKIQVENRMQQSSWIMTDEMRLRQILMNILGNAVKFTSQGMIIIYLYRKESDRVEISVKDTGIGISLADAERLFQPFAQVTNPTARRFGGTGLGLSLSRKLAELLGGNLFLEWSRPDVGSCFVVTVQDQTLDKELFPERNLTIKEAHLPVNFNGRRVLVAEDSEDNQLLLNYYLQSTGVDLTFADNGRIALDLISKNKFDLVLMDIQMPEMDGFEATQELRRRGWNGRIIALTAHALQPERERAMKNGFDNYLVKPIQRETLIEAMAESLSKT